MGIFSIANSLVDSAIDIATQPLRDGLDVLDGLSEGEIRTQAIARLGVDAVINLTPIQVAAALAKSIENE